MSPKKALPVGVPLPAFAELLATGVGLIRPPAAEGADLPIILHGLVLVALPTHHSICLALPRIAILPTSI